MSNTKPDSSQVKYIPAGAGAVATDVQGKLRESVSVKDFGAVGDGSTLDTAAFTAAQAAALFAEVPAGMNCKVGPGLDYWKFFGRGNVFENGKHWTLAPFPQTGTITKSYVNRTFGNYEQAVGQSVTINSGVAQTKENTQVLGTDTLGLAQSYTDRDHVAQYLSSYSYVPDVLDATATYTANSLTNAAVGALYAAGGVKPGMIIDTQHADICTSRVQSVAGNVITVDVWYARSGGGAITPANGTGAIINPNNKVFGQNILVIASGNGTTTGSQKFAGVELDLITPASAVPISGTWGYDMVSIGASYVDVGYQIRGNRNISYFSNNAGGAGLYGFRSVGDARGVSVEDATVTPINVVSASVSVFSVTPNGTVFAGAVVTGGAVTEVGSLATQVSTSWANIGQPATNGSQFWVQGFNTAGGAQGNFFFMTRIGTVVMVAASDGSGCGVQFQMVANQLQMQTTSGTFQFHYKQTYV